MADVKEVSAEEIAKEFKEHSVAEFFKKNRQMLGLVGKVRCLTTIVHEFVSNSLDACEEARILPDIDVRIDELAAENYEVTVSDNGPGMTKEIVGRAFGKLLAGTKFHRMMQMRGQQGIGACMKSDTLVPFADGRIFPIKEIVDKDMVGEEVVSLDLNSMKLVPGKIIKCWKPKNPLFVKFRTVKGREISLTPENPVLILQEGKPVWIRADEVTEGMKIAAPVRLFGFPQNKPTIELFDENNIQVDNRNSLKQILQTVGVQGENGRFLNVLAEADVTWLEVSEIAFEKNEEDFVYDLEIETYHNFIAGGIICHNSGCVLFSQITTGRPTKVITGTGNKSPISLEVSVDPKKNEPKISNMLELKKEFRGTAIKAQFKDVLYRQGEQSPLEYLRRTAVANPHAQISFKDPFGKKTTFKRTSSQIPPKPEIVKPHPKGASVDELLTLAKYTEARKLSSFLKTEFDRMGDKAVKEIGSKISFDLNKDPRKLEWNEAEEIVKAFRQIAFIAPRTEALKPIGEDRITKSLKSIVKPEFLSVITRKPQVYSGGFPFVVEVGVAYGGEAGRAVANGTKQDGMEEGAQARAIEIMRFANRAPLLFDTGGCAITKAVQSVEWKRYGIKDLDNAPLTVFVNLVSVHVPYTSAGKQAVAEEPEILEEIRLALMDSGRRTAHYISSMRKEADKKMKRETFYKYIPEIAGALHAVTKEDEEKLRKGLEKLVVEKLKFEEKEEKEAAKEEEEALPIEEVEEGGRDE